MINEWRKQATRAGLGSRTAVEERSTAKTPIYLAQTCWPRQFFLLIAVD